MRIGLNLQKFDMWVDRKLLILLLLAFFVRLLWLKQNLFFGFEQGRDFLTVQQIFQGNISLIGPWASIQGFFHGALWYWFLTIPYFLFQGDPYLVSIFIITINVVSFIFIYYALKDLYDAKTGILAVLFLSLSYSSIIYSRWLSNVNLVPAVTALMFFALIYSRKNPVWLALAALAWGALFHFHSIVATFLIPAIFGSVYLLNIRLSIRSTVLSLAAVFVMLSPYIAFEIRHDFLMTNALKKFAQVSTTSKIVDRSGSFDQFWNQVNDSLLTINNQASQLLFLTILIGIFLLKAKRSTFIIALFLLVVPILFSLLGMRPQRHYFITVPLFLSIAAAIFARYLLDKHKLLGGFIISVILIGNILSIYSKMPKSIGNFIHHAQYTYLQDQLNIIDYAYKNAKGRPFSYDYYTIPWWKNEGWQYLFSWYGAKKYGYMPITGSDRTQEFYVIIEPEEEKVPYQANWHYDLDQESKIIDTYTSGKLLVEKRQLL